MRRVYLVVLCHALACGSSVESDPHGDGGNADLAPVQTFDDAGHPIDASAASDGSAATNDGGIEDAAVPNTDAGFDINHVKSTISGTTVGTAGCNQTGAPTGLRTISLTVGSATRTGTVFVPTTYDPKEAHPVVFVFHGDGGTGASIRGGLNLETAAGGKAIFAYPDGAGKTWNDTLKNANSDMDFVMALRTSLRNQYCVDMKRTFITGHSRGGYFTNQIACKYGVAEFAAIAPLSSTIGTDVGNAYVYGPPKDAGGPYLEDDNWDFMCPVDGTPSNNPPLPKLPPPAMVMHGQCDTEPGVEYPEGRRVAEHWGFAARCTSSPAIATNPNQTCGTTCPTTSIDPCYVAPGCAANHEVLFCAIPGMEHAVWCQAPTRIWAFFAAH